MAVRKRRSAAKDGAEKLLLTSTAAGATSASPSESTMGNLLRRQPVWILLAVASGACAAFNGVFAKLTTTALTSDLSAAIARLLSLSPDNKPIEVAIRAGFFGLNIVFNIAMWALFTAALTRGSSTTRVSIVNVSANFMITALLGLAVFGEKLPPMWWVGAGLLAGGNVVIGRREEAEKPGGTIGLEETVAEAQSLLGENPGGNVELEDVAEGQATEESKRLRRGEDIDDPI